MRFLFKTKCHTEKGNHYEAQYVSQLISTKFQSRVTTTRSGTEPPNAEEFPGPQENRALSCISNRSKTVILPTAVVWVLNHSTGSCIQARAVLDSGSMSNIVTQDFPNKLGAPQNRINIPVEVEIKPQSSQN
ncbi:hypothetical protein TNCV_4942641 [Trichonephila clavipes]|nr:hypothetical protein TNCV_4942641 [Trichonephila clavipes]